MLTGNKDIDRKILNELEDEDLVNVCQTNKKAQSLCNDQVFWMNRVFLRFGYVGGEILRKHKGNRTWSEYYIKDLRKIKNHTTIKLLSGSQSGRLDHVIISLKNGANIHTLNDQALRSASYYGRIEVVKYLVGHGANIHAVDDGALRLASENGQIEVVKYLVELKPDGANIHANNDNALRAASQNGRIEVVKYLVNLGANIHANNDDALRGARFFGHTEVVKYLENIEDLLKT